MCNAREDETLEKRRDWLASALWALLPVGVLALAAVPAFLGDLPRSQAWIGLPFVFPALLLDLALASVLPLRWADWLAETITGGLEVGLLAAACLASWWLVFTVLAYPVCRARRINRSMARILGVTP